MQQGIQLYRLPDNTVKEQSECPFQDANFDSSMEEPSKYPSSARSFIKIDAGITDLFLTPSNYLPANLFICTSICILSFPVPTLV